MKDLSMNNELLSETGCFRIYPDKVEPGLQPCIDRYLAPALRDLFVKHSALVIINSYDRFPGNFRKKDRKLSLTGGIGIQAHSILGNVGFYYRCRLHPGHRSTACSRNERGKIASGDHLL